MKRCCGTCESHCFSEDVDEWVCTNSEAECFGIWTDYDDCCDDYEPKEGQE